VSSVDAEMRTLFRTGKLIVGWKKASRLVKEGKCKLLIASSTLRRDLLDSITKAAESAGIPVYKYPGSGWDLGAYMGKPFMVSTIAVLDLGESKLAEALASRRDSPVA